MAKYDDIQDENTPEQPPLTHSQRTHMYDGWVSRYNGLGLTGVIALPNTTFEDWLIWYRGWIKQFTVIYNETINDIDDRLTNLEEKVDNLPVNMLDLIEVTDVDVIKIILTDFSKTSFKLENYTTTQNVDDADYVYTEVLPTSLVMIGV